MNKIDPNNNEDGGQRSKTIGLDDIFVALRYLAPESEKTRKAIVNALGFEWRTTVSSEQETKSAPSGSEVKSPESTPTDEKKETVEASSPGVRILQPQQETDIDLNDIFTGVEWEDFEVLTETNVDEHFKKPRYISLFDEKWFRAIMSLLLSTSMPTAEIDFKLVEKSIVQLSPIGRVPYRNRQSLERGVQILLDISESMQPFWRDETELLASLAHLLDAHRTNVFEFELETLSQGRIIWQEGSPEKLQPEMPVLLVTNFGIAGDQSAGRIRDNEPLLKLLDQAKNKKCQVIALVPLPEKHFPSDLKNLIPFSIVWDRSTSPQVVSRIKRC